MKVLLIGYGRWGHILAGKLEDLVGRANLVISDLVPHDEYEHGSLFAANYAQVLDQVDACVVATLPGQHFTVALDCLKAGKPTLVEKPLTLSTKGARALLEVAAQEGVGLMVDDTWLYDGGAGYLIETGILKGVKSLALQWSNPRTETPDEGILWTQGPHPISIMLKMLGSMPEKVQGALGRRQARLEYSGFPSAPFAKVYVDMTWDTEQKLRLGYMIDGDNGQHRFDGLQYEHAPEQDPLTKMLEHFLTNTEQDVHAFDVVSTLAATERILR